MSLSRLNTWISFLEMRQKRFLIYLLIELAVIPAVLLLFKFTPEKKVAAAQAGFLFVGVPLLLVQREFLKYRSRVWLWFAGHLQFLFLFALPIFGLRVLNWQADFNSLAIFGVTGKTLHSFSNISFIWMLISSAWTYWSYRGK